MYEETSDTSDVDEEDFLNALALLHSTEDDSAEKLRKMLDASIERRYGFDKTLTARMPRRFLQNAKPRGKPFATEKSEACGKRVVASRRIGNQPLSGNNAAESNWKSMRIVNADVEDYSEKGEIPRISIPDEGSGDGLLCKICNGAKLGPLILLECQECQEVYHPLCHHPPVVDIDVYDPRIVWRCKKCTDTSPINSSEKKPKRSRVDVKIKEATASSEEAGKSNGNLSNNEINVEQILTDAPQRPGCAVEDALVTKGSFHLNQKTTWTQSSNQLRKRVGSKLSVTRSVIK
ncbi:integrator complex subunit 12-like [Ceratina calcarata]|uniref:Integrator complex subunit 12 n=1 Tax=Ceratina calcarata TaxID=156304 RepID=A0AAJ7N499_9HYME|nr:integrator complex subunit 12-like [Ceratina calcarata]